MELRPSAYALVRLGVLLLVVAAGAAVWELFALQPPHSRFQAGVLAEPIAQLRGTATVYALVLLAAAWLLPWAWPDKEPKAIVAAVHAAVVLTIGALVYGASRSLMGLQILDLRTDAQVMFGTRVVGQGLSMGCLLVLAWRLLRRRPERAPRSSDSDAGGTQ